MTDKSGNRRDRHPKLKTLPGPNVFHNPGVAGAKEIRVESIQDLMIIKAI
jgi:hypothetical protein